MPAIGDRENGKEGGSDNEGNIDKTDGKSPGKSDDKTDGQHDEKQHNDKVDEALMLEVCHHLLVVFFQIWGGMLGGIGDKSFVRLNSLFHELIIAQNAFAGVVLP